MDMHLCSMKAFVGILNCHFDKSKTSYNVNYRWIYVKTKHKQGVVSRPQL